jgi:DHA1 family solute carrier family 18 vesicular amine transporter 1/2
MVGTPAGGGLYTRFGFHAPFIFGGICTVVDLILRLLIIERDVAIRWGYDPATRQHVNTVADLEASSSPHHSSHAMGPSALALTPVYPLLEQTTALVDPKLNPSTPNTRTPSSNNLTMSEIPLVRKPLPMLSVIGLLGQSPRAVVALIMSLIYGYVVVTSRWSC